jgi:lipoprotein NlpI
MKNGFLYALMFVVSLTGFSSSAMADGYADAKAGIAALERGDMDGAILLFTYALDSGQLSSKNREMILSDRGVAWLDKSDLDKAIDDFGAAIRLDPSDAYAFNNRGQAWYAKGYFDKAIDDYTAAIKFDPSDADALSNRGLAWQAKGYDDKAISDYTEAIKLNPVDAQAFFNRGNTWLNRGEFDKAIADYGNAIRLTPQKIDDHANRKYADVLSNRAIAWRGKGQYDMAAADYSDLVRMNPSDAKALHNRGLMRFYQGKFKDAASDFAATRQMNPDDPYLAIWLYLARARQQDGDARAELAVNTKALGAEQWPAPIVAMLMDKLGAAAVAAKAKASDPNVRKGRMCEADFYGGEWYLLKEEAKQAGMLFRQAQKMCPKNLVEYTSAFVELKRL